MKKFGKEYYMHQFTGDIGCNLNSGTIGQKGEDMTNEYAKALEKALEATKELGEGGVGGVGGEGEEGGVGQGDGDDDVGGVGGGVGG